MRVPAALAIVLALGSGLSGCGARKDLKPQAGHSLPVAPFGREQPRTVEALLKPPVQAAPERTVELRKRSEERDDDPFDLPPTD